MTDIAPTLAIGSVETLRHVSNRPRAGDWDRHDLELLARHFLYSLDLFQESMRAFRELLSEGAEARPMGRDCRMTLEAVDSYLAALSPILSHDEFALPPPDHPLAILPVGKIDELREAHRQATEIKASLSRLLDLLNAPRPSIDWRRVQAAEAEFARGEGEDLAEAVDRMKAGGDL